MSVNVIWQQVDVGGKEDSILNVSTEKSFSKILRLKDEFPTVTKYATLEPGRWKLDGTYKMMESDDCEVNAVWWSEEQSDDNGDFATYPVLTIEFTKDRSSGGITFVFDEATDEYCTDLTVAWYQSTGALIKSVDFQPDAANYFCENIVENYTKIVATFKATNKAYRRLKISDVNYGRIIKINEGLIKAEILEEISPTGEQISINTATISFLDNYVSILDSKGVYVNLRKLHPFDFYVGDEYFGRYYMNKWTGSDGITPNKFSLIDVVGLLELTTFKGGIYDGVTAKDLLDELFDGMPEGIEYTIEESLQDILLNGWLEKDTIRESVKQVCFAIGAVVDTSRQNVVAIKSLSDTVHSVDITRRSDKQSIKIETKVTDVSLMAHSFVLSGESKKVHEEEYTAGEYDIELSKPCGNYTIDNGTIIDANANYIVFTTEGGTVLINGEEYIDTETEYTASVNTTENLREAMELDEYTLVDDSKAQAIADRLLDYYSSQYINEFSVELAEERVGEFSEVYQTDTQVIRGVIEEMEIDLLNDKITDIKVRGEVV